MSSVHAQALDWAAIDLVVFDIDGTLYHAGRLRLLMAAWLAGHALVHASLAVPRRLAAFRRMREALGEATARAWMQEPPGRAPDFRALQYRLAAQRAGCSAAEMEALVEAWMEQRPLRLLRACRRQGVAALFADLRRLGKRVAVLSDYPAQAKLQALGLEADLVLWAGDADVGRLKPDPRGLQQLMARTGVPAHRTVMVGDRNERDGLAARLAGAHAVIIGRAERRQGSGAADDAGGHAQHGTAAGPAGSHAHPWWIRGFDDPLFDPLRSAAAWAAASA